MKEEKNSAGTAVQPESELSKNESSDQFSVTLIQCPAWGRETPPVAISLLGANLRSKGYKVHLFDLNNELYHKVAQEDRLHWNQEYYGYWGDANVKELINKYSSVVDSFVDEIIAKKSKIIGFSLVFTAKSFTNVIAEMIKKRLPECKIVYGGASTAEYAGGLLLLDKWFVDALVLREGDITLPVICNDLKEKGEFVNTPGLVFKKDGEIINGGLREPAHSLDEIPFPDYSDFDLFRYSDPHRLDMFSSRGCVNQCHYCDERKYLQRYRFRSGKSLFEEVQYHLSKYPWVRTFNFADSVLNGSLKEIGEFARLLVDNNVKVYWSGQAIVRKDMTPELLQLLAKSGCLYLGYGVETGSDAVLKSMNKKLCSIDGAENNLRDTHNAGIKAYANFMFGYPTETEEDFQQTLDFVSRNRQNIDGVSPSQSFTVIVPNTYLYENPEMFGVEKNPHHLYWSSLDGKNTYPVRFDRYERFCRLCVKLGIGGVGVVDEKIDKWRQLGAYYKFKKDFDKAIECYQKDIEKYGYSLYSFESLMECYKSGTVAVPPEFLQTVERITQSLNETIGNLELKIKELTAAGNSAGDQQGKQLSGTNLPEAEKLQVSKRSNEDIARINALTEKAQKFIEQKKYFDAFHTLQNILREDSANTLAQKNVTMLNDRITSERKALKWDSKKSTKNIMEAESLIEKKVFSGAKSRLRKVLDLEPSHIEAINDLAVINILEENFEYASELINRVLSLEPGNEVAVGNMEYLKSIYTEKAEANIEIEESVSCACENVTEKPVSIEAKPLNGTITEVSPKPKGIICVNPFYEFEIDITGNVVVCCTGWFKHSLGNMKRQNIAEVWNSRVARYVRRKMYKGEWQDICNPHCPTIVEYNKFNKVIPYDELHLNKNLTPEHVEEIKAGKDYLNTTPTYFKLSDSKVCNLHCKMCSVVADDNYKDDPVMIEKRSEDILKYLDKARTMLLCGNGDPFARKDTRELLMNYKNENSELKFALITNGLLLPRYWDKVKHQKYESIDISIDAASKDIYEKIRTGGKWENILETLKIVKENRDKFESVLISMVVMRSNYKEIPAFIDFVESYGFIPMFSRIQGMFDSENIFEMNDQVALDELRSIISAERLKKRTVRVIWQDLIEFAD